MSRLAVVLSLAISLAVADLVWKAAEPTPAWAFHERSPAWLILSVATLAAMLVVVRIPARWIPLAAGLLAGGVLGNTLSAAWNDLAVPNPIVVEGESGVIAFNLADVWALLGIVALTLAIGTWLVRNREVLPSPAEARARWASALRRRR
jgi:xanthine/uracil permease